MMPLTLDVPASHHDDVALATPAVSVKTMAGTVWTILLPRTPNEELISIVTPLPSPPRRMLPLLFMLMPVDVNADPCTTKVDELLLALISASVNEVPFVVTLLMPPKAPALLYCTCVVEPPGAPPPPAGTDQAPVAFKKEVAAAPLLPGTTPCAVVLVENGMSTAVVCVGVRSP